ncbi:MAG TPA: SRPBCC family protein [Acidimicrobiales bacterium]|jgi:uncharacterized protein YndB with AHSA1/START domain|nr:SRPBCC family protein [Acidimicrobiales bacterium]
MPDVEDFATLGQADNGRWRLDFTRLLPHPPAQVWQALTEPEKLDAWFPVEVHGERAPGAPLRLVFAHDEGPAMDGEMLAYNPPALLELRWGDDEFLRFELTPADDAGTVLAFRNTFGPIGKAARDAAGWHARLDLLRSVLRGEPAPWTADERWAEVHAGYVERLGPEASAIGPPA